ncbi:MAG: hypothetical protein JO369_09115 [Paucibacter sp.]|nr:hypothetical protein [Roseateles sp.]
MDLAIRPKLVTFRAVRFFGDNPSPDGSQPWSLETKQTIELAHGATHEGGARQHSMVRIELDSTAKKADGEGEPAVFKGTYEARFDFPEGVSLEQVTLLMAQEPFQYGLVSQAFPLAMTLFRRELQTLGFDARELPLGI